MTSRAEPPDYLGRVLAEDGRAIGTCFQVSPGVLVTAWHVLNDVEAGQIGSDASVDLLAGGAARQSAKVRAVDALHDLAVLTCEVPFPRSVAGLVATDSVPLSTDVILSGVADLPFEPFRYIPANGEWHGNARRDEQDDQVLLGKMRAPDVVRGMSGAPVRLVADDRVVGVVSARYNSADGWMRNVVWVARIEDLRALLTELADVRVEVLPPRRARGRLLIVACLIAFLALVIAAFVPRTLGLGELMAKESRPPSQPAPSQSRARVWRAEVANTWSKSRSADIGVRRYRSPLRNEPFTPGFFSGESVSLVCYEPDGRELTDPDTGQSSRLWYRLVDGAWLPSRFIQWPGRKPAEGPPPPDMPRCTGVS
jgi:hypothetical protein